MSGFSRFGDYVLLRKLSEDALGESYRAGRVDDAGALSDVALLRLFSGAGIDAQRLLDNQRPVPQASGGSGLPRQLAMGVEAGICFVAYEYNAGKDLATLIKRANDGFSSLAAEHALLIAERVAKGLAWLHREHEAAHGFVVPELVQVSDEGETKLHGFEVGPALVPLAIHGAIKPAFRSYLSPEVLAGAAPGPRDDVFSLGALLLQLLTGTPPGAEESVSARLQRARMVENEQPIPATLQQLIAESLAPPSSRPADAKAWHEQFGTWMAESGIRATNFDLAFFVQELFRDDLKRETVERDDERRRLQAPAPSVAASTPASTVAIPPMMVETPSPDRVESEGEPPIPAVEPATGGRGKLLGGVAALAVLGLAGWFLVPRFLSSDSDAQSPAVTRADTQQVVPPESDPVGAPGSVTDPAIDAALDPTALDGVADEEGAGSARAMSLDAASDDLEKLIQERASALEERLATEYDQEIAAMRSQLEAARKIEAEARAALTAGAPAEGGPPTAAEPAPAAIVAQAPATETPATETPATETSVAEASVSVNGAAIIDANETSPAVPPRRAPSGAAGATELVPPPATKTTAEPAAPSPATTGSAGPGATDTSTATPSAGPAEAADAAGPGASSAPPPPKVTKAVAPHLIEPPAPRYPAAARSARRSATVIVKVLVGRDGRVRQADMVSDKKIGYGFDQAALSAARKAIYEPATVDGKAIEQWTTLVLRFEP